MPDEGRAVFRVATPFFYWVVYDPTRPRSMANVFNVTIFILLSPLLLISGMIASLFMRPKYRSAQEVTTLLLEALEDRLSSPDWDDFTCIPIADAELDTIRMEAADLNLADLDKFAMQALVQRSKALTDVDAPLIKAPPALHLRDR